MKDAAKIIESTKDRQTIGYTLTLDSSTSKQNVDNFIAKIKRLDPQLKPKASYTLEIENYSVLNEETKKHFNKVVINNPYFSEIVIDGEKQKLVKLEETKQSVVTKKPTAEKIVKTETKTDMKDTIASEQPKIEPKKFANQIRFREGSKLFIEGNEQFSIPRDMGTDCSIFVRDFPSLYIQNKESAEVKRFYQGDAPDTQEDEKSIQLILGTQKLSIKLEQSDDISIEDKVRDDITTPLTDDELNDAKKKLSEKTTVLKNLIKEASGFSDAVVDDVEQCYTGQDVTGQNAPLEIYLGGKENFFKLQGQGTAVLREKDSKVGFESCFQTNQIAEANSGLKQSSIPTLTTFTNTSPGTYKDKKQQVVAACSINAENIDFSKDKIQENTNLAIGVLFRVFKKDGDAIDIVGSDFKWFQSAYDFIYNDSINVLKTIDDSKKALLINIIENIQDVPKEKCQNVVMILKTLKSEHLQKIETIENIPGIASILEKDIQCSGDDLSKLINNFQRLQKAKVLTPNNITEIVDYYKANSIVPSVIELNEFLGKIETEKTTGYSQSFEVFVNNSKKQQACQKLETLIRELKKFAGQVSKLSAALKAIPDKVTLDDYATTAKILLRTLLRVNFQNYMADRMPEKLPGYIQKLLQIVKDSDDVLLTEKLINTSKGILENLKNENEQAKLLSQETSRVREPLLKTVKENDRELKKLIEEKEYFSKQLSKLDSGYKVEFLGVKNSTEIDPRKGIVKYPRIEIDEKDYKSKVITKNDTVYLWVEEIEHISGGGGEDYPRVSKFEKSINFTVLDKGFPYTRQISAETLGSSNYSKVIDEIKKKPKVNDLESTSGWWNRVVQHLAHKGFPVITAETEKRKDAQIANTRKELEGAYPEQDSLEQVIKELREKLEKTINERLKEKLEKLLNEKLKEKEKIEELINEKLREKYDAHYLCEKINTLDKNIKDKQKIVDKQHEKVRELWLTIDACEKKIEKNENEIKRLDTLVASSEKANASIKETSAVVNAHFKAATNVSGTCNYVGPLNAKIAGLVPEKDRLNDDLKLKLIKKTVSKELEENYSWNNSWWPVSKKRKAIVKTLKEKIESSTTEQQISDALAVARENAKNDDKEANKSGWRLFGLLGVNNVTGGRLYQALNSVSHQLKLIQVAKSEVKTLEKAKIETETVVPVPEPLLEKTVTKIPVSTFGGVISKLTDGDVLNKLANVLEIKETVQGIVGSPTKETVEWLPTTRTGLEEEQQLLVTELDALKNQPPVHVNQSLQNTTADDNDVRRVIKSK